MATKLDWLTQEIDVVHPLDVDPVFGVLRLEQPSVAADRLGFAQP